MRQRSRWEQEGARMRQRRSTPHQNVAALADQQKQGSVTTQGAQLDSSRVKKGAAATAGPTNGPAGAGTEVQTHMVTLEDEQEQGPVTTQDTYLDSSAAPSKSKLYRVKKGAAAATRRSSLPTGSSLATASGSRSSSCGGAGGRQWQCAHASRRAQSAAVAQVGARP